MIIGYDYTLLDLLEELEREMQAQPFYASKEKNLHGTCWTFTLATLFNYYTGKNQYEGKENTPRNSYSNCWQKHFMNTKKYKPYEPIVKDLKTLVEQLSKYPINKNFELVVCCHSRYHSICIINNKIYSNGQELTYNEYLNSMWITRSPKIKMMLEVNEEIIKMYKEYCEELKLNR